MEAVEQHDRTGLSCRLLVGLGTCALNLADSTRGTSQLGRKGGAEGGKEGSSRTSQKGPSPAANG